MKTFYLLLFYCSILSNSGYCSIKDIPVLTIEKVVKYDFNPENSFKIEVTDSDNITVKAENLASLKGLKIHHIDLVYTAYQGKKTFNQNAVNKKQIELLKKMVPQVVPDDPTWKCIEQTGAKNTKEAKTFFHGFVVHYGPNLDYQHLKSFFSPFQKAPKTFTVNATEGGRFDAGNGSWITIAPNSVNHKDSTPVEGEFTLVYQEFKETSDILFSGIPMTYNSGQRSHSFSSVGMFDLRAEQNGKPLDMSKPANVDFNCTSVKDGVGFYEMNDSTGEWTKKKEVAFRPLLELKSKFNSTLEIDDIMFGLDADIYNLYSVIRFNDDCWDWMFTHFATYPELNQVLEKLDEEGKTAQTTIEPKQLVEMIAEIMMEEKKAEMQREMEKQIALEQQRQKEWEEQERKRIEAERAEMERLRHENARFKNTLLAEGADEGHTYPALVKGLNSPEFGVYNCDQIYQIQAPLELSPVYLDEGGSEINGKHVVCVMDLNFNGSFSFHPNNITCSGKGRNVILLFTNNKDVYMLSEEKYNELNVTENFRPVFKMKNMTGTIKNSDDLKAYLKL